MELPAPLLRGECFGCLDDCGTELQMCRSCGESRCMYPRAALGDVKPCVCV